eukprot:1158664-Pelagomonas_calceolata.AAC.3
MQGPLSHFPDFEASPHKGSGIQCNAEGTLPFSHPKRESKWNQKRCRGRSHTFPTLRHPPTKGVESSAMQRAPSPFHIL